MYSSIQTILATDSEESRPDMSNVQYAFLLEAQSTPEL
jgi:hypothetical protein